MPMIKVEMFKGRTVDEKRALVKELTEGFVRAAGGRREGVHVVLTEVEPVDWGVGGELCSDRQARS